MKRLKHVFSSSSEVLHLWANQSQESARQGGRITRCYFHGTSAYSYGSHYELGRIVTYKGVKVGIVNNTGYSHTTSNHIRSAEAALDGVMPYLSASTFNVFDALIEVQDKLVDGLMDLFSRRSFYSGYKYGDSYHFTEVKKFNETAKALKHPELCLDVTKEFIELGREHVAACIKRAEELKSPEAEARREAARIKRAEAELRKNAASVEAWRLGGPTTNFIRQLKPQLLRIQGNELVTSSGARVALAEAAALFRKIDAGVAKPETSIGPYTFNSVNGDGLIKVGCHLIKIDEARRVLGNVAAPLRLVK